MESPRVLNRQLQTAVIAADEAGIRKAVHKGADVNAVQATGFCADDLTPLQDAAARGNESVVRLLVSLGAAPDAADNPAGATAVYLAAQYGRSSIVKVLAKCGASIDRPDNCGVTPVWMASQG